MEANIIAAFGEPNLPLAVASIACAVAGIAFAIRAIAVSESVYLFIIVPCWLAAAIMGFIWIAFHDDHKDRIAAEACHSILDDYQTALDTQDGQSGDEAGRTIRHLLDSGDTPIRSGILAALKEDGCSSRHMSKTAEKWIAERHVAKSSESGDIETLISILGNR